MLAWSARTVTDTSSQTRFDRFISAGSTFTGADHGAGQVDEAGDVDGTALVAGCEAAEMLETVKASLDLVAVLRMAVSCGMKILRLDHVFTTHNVRKASSRRTSWNIAG